MIDKDYLIAVCRTSISNLEEVVQTLEEREEFEDLAITDPPVETFNKMNKLYNAMREKVND